MKLWVDDMRDAPDDTWTEARKVQTAINLLANFTFEEISLDHDIENRPDDETFKPVAHYIGMKYGSHEKMFWPKITVHSMNPVGGAELVKILADYGLPSEYIPYPKALEEFNAKFM